MTTVAPDATPRSAVRSPEPNPTETALLVLSGSGFGGADLASVRRTLAYGEVFRSARAAVGASDNESLKTFFDCLTSIVQRVERHQSLKPLIRAAERIEAEARPAAQPGHFSWCLPGQCFTQHYEDGESYTDHRGLRVDMPIPLDMDCAHDQLLSADLGALEEFTNEPMVSFNSGGNGVLLQGDDLDDVIDNLSNFVDGLRTMRGQINQGRQS